MNRSKPARRRAGSAREGCTARTAWSLWPGTETASTWSRWRRCTPCPGPGDVILLPCDGVGESKKFLPGAYLVESVEHFYTSVDRRGSRPQEARLTKAVAKVTSLNPTLTA